MTYVILSSLLPQRVQKLYVIAKRTCTFAFCLFKELFLTCPFFVLCLVSYFWSWSCLVSCLCCVFSLRFVLLCLCPVSRPLSFVVSWPCHILSGSVLLSLFVACLSAHLPITRQHKIIVNKGEDNKKDKDKNEDTPDKPMYLSA